MKPARDPKPGAGTDAYATMSRPASLHLGAMSLDRRKEVGVSRAKPLEGWAQPPLHRQPLRHSAQRTCTTKTSDAAEGAASVKSDDQCCSVNP